MKRTDFVGLILAAACVVHCLAMPLVLVYLPLLGMSWLTDPKVHYVLLGAGLTLGGLSFLPGYRVHRRAWIPTLAAVGLGTMAYAAVYQEDQCCRRPPANTVAEVMQNRPVGLAVPTSSRVVVDTDHPSTTDSTGAKRLKDGTELPDCCQTGHCATKEKSQFGHVSATVASLGLTPWLPRSSTPVGATLLLVAHILNLRFRGFRGCAADCCAEDERSLPDPAVNANQMSQSTRDTSDPSDETAR